MNPRAKLRPLKGKVLVEPQPVPELSPGGILIPETARDKSTQHIVRGVAEGQGGFGRGDRVVTSGRVQGLTLDMHPRKLRLVMAEEVKAVFI
jgi:co-chaperonin GroES (HSP10)